MGAGLSSVHEPRTIQVSSQGMVGSVHAGRIDEETRDTVTAMPVQDIGCKAEIG